MLRESKHTQQGRYDELKKKLMEVECRLNDCIGDSQRIQLVQKNHFGQLQTQIVEVEELMKMQMNNMSGRKASNDKMAEEELVRKLELISSEQDHLQKQFINFQNSVDQMLEKQNKHSNTNNTLAIGQEQLGLEKLAGTQSYSHHNQVNSIQSTIPILRNSQEYILKDSQEITQDTPNQPKRQLDNFDDIMDRTKKII